MFHTIGKWLIGRLVERDAPLPGWLRRWVDRDEELSRFEVALRRLDSLLRSDAPAWMARQSSDLGVEQFAPAVVRSVPHRPPWITRPSARIGAACALAASVLLALAWWQGFAPEAPKPAGAGCAPLAVQPAGSLISPSERAQLVAAWQASRVHADAWQARVKQAARRFEAIDLRGRRAQFLAVEFTTDAPQRITRALNSAVKSQQQDLTTSVKSAYAFFAHRLPASVAILVGLQDG